MGGTSVAPVAHWSSAKGSRGQGQGSGGGAGRAPEVTQLHGSRRGLSGARGTARPPRQPRRDPRDPPLTARPRGRVRAAGRAAARAPTAPPAAARPAPRPAPLPPCLRVFCLATAPLPPNRRRPPRAPRFPLAEGRGAASRPSLGREGGRALWLCRRRCGSSGRAPAKRRPWDPGALVAPSPRCLHPREAACGRPRVHREKPRGQQGGSLYAAPHQTLLDPYVVSAAPSLSPHDQIK